MQRQMLAPDISSSAYCRLTPTVHMQTGATEGVLAVVVAVLQ